MEDIGHETLELFSNAENYNCWICEKIEPYLGNRIIEIGCGIGNLTKFLLRNRFVVAVDVSEKYVDLVRKKFDNESLAVVRCDASSSKLLELSQYAPDTVVCINVLEHIEDEDAVLKNIHSVLPAGGKLILFVPALRGLYGTLDAELGHFRRYNKRYLTSKLGSLSFNVVELSYFNGPGIAGWFLSSRILRRRIVPSGQLGLYNKLIPLVAKIEKLVPPYIGLSLLAVCEKA